MFHAAQTKRTRYATAICLGCIFAVMFLLNRMTPYVADDWVYTLSFATREPIAHIMDIFPSMYVHSSHMNGRIISHGLVQLSYIPPTVVFDLCNSLFFCAAMYASFRICTVRAKRSVLLLAVFSMGFWCLLPAFGQVCLWQIGSVNYLWALVFGLMYLMPFIRFYMFDSNAQWKLWTKIVFAVFAFLVGMYTEITSFVVLMLSVLLILSGIKRKSIRTWLWLPIVCEAVGYVVLLHMPAEMQAKQSEMTFSVLLNNFVNATDMLLRHMWPALVLWVVLLVVVRWRHGSVQRIWLSVLFAFGAVAANYMLIVAAYYAERCMCTTTLFLLIACGILLADPALWGAGKQLRPAACGGFVVLTAVFAVCFVAGSRDIWTSYQSFQEREASIAQSVASGETDVELPCIQAFTQYSAFYDLVDLNTEQRDTWPNNQMAKYYGLHSIIGK
ncbi:MAG: DUF6056 family protein [Eubacteriales bacterium]|nr:DUF6056 family protein [Eubacteriales bacterium]